MADATAEQLRRQGLADAVVVITLSRRFPRMTSEDWGEVLGLSQREVIAAIERMRSGESRPTRVRTVAQVQAELAALQTELKHVRAHEAAAIRAEREAAKQAQRELKAAAVEADRARKARARDLARSKREEDQARRSEEREAERARARAEKAPRFTRPAAQYKDAGTCPECGKPDVRNMGSHRRSHRMRHCEICGTQVSEMAWGTHQKRHREEGT